MLPDKGMQREICPRACKTALDGAPETGSLGKFQCENAVTTADKSRKSIQDGSNVISRAREQQARETNSGSMGQKLEKVPTWRTSDVSTAEELFRDANYLINEKAEP